MRARRAVRFDSREGMSVAMTCRDVAAMSGMVIWRSAGGVCAMAIAYMARIGGQRRGIGLIRRSYCSDPYARRVEGELKDHPLLHGGHDEPDYRDNAAVAPKRCQRPYDWEDDAAPRRREKTVIYEAHVQGLTYLHRNSREIRGTYKALGHPVMVAYFKQLGITALELLPVARLPAEAAPATYGADQLLGFTTRWRYSRCIPHRPDSPETALDGSFRDAVKALHRAGIEVILDIVLNHSAERIWTVQPSPARVP